MTELDLYKFINNEEDGGCEVLWNGEELICWIDYFKLSDFIAMIKGFLDDDGYDVNLRPYDIAFDLVPICEYYDIEPENILKKDGEN